MTVRLIYGPPGAGKSTYAREHAQDGDLVIDLDDIRANVGNEDTARKLRGVMESTARQHEGDVWIVRTLAKADERAEFMARVGVDEAIPLAVDADTAKERVRKRDGSDEKLPAIDRWWAEYTPDMEDAAMAEHDETNQAETSQDQGATPEVAERKQEGLPADIPVSEMSLEDQVTYWKRRSRANEKDAREYREQAERVEAERKAPEAPVAPSVDPAQREVFEARVDAALATRPDYAGVPFAKHLDMSTFVGDDGRVDREAVAAFFEALPQGAHKTAGTPAGWGSNAPYEGASGIDAGREMFKASRAKN